MKISRDSGKLYVEGIKNLRRLLQVRGPGNLITLGGRKQNPQLLTNVRGQRSKHGSSVGYTSTIFLKVVRISLRKVISCFGPHCTEIVVDGRVFDKTEPVYIITHTNDSDESPKLGDL